MDSDSDGHDSNASDGDEGLGSHALQSISKCF
jgi:hypothetical protein